ncbi:MAG TPA: hypothetical protein VGU73_07070, partial [Acidimicrobiia bacterium]|nr:hypothetical protein [Acidimicrobiia bacterium]
LKIRQTRFATFGDWEVEASVSRESVWDADELEAAMRQLADEGVIRAGDFSDVITRPPVVSRSNAKALLAHLDGEARERVAAACSWKEKPGKLTVARSVDLAAALEPADGGDGRPPEAGLSLDFRRERQGAVSAPEPAPAPPPTLTPEELFA